MIHLFRLIMSIFFLFNLSFDAFADKPQLAVFVSIMPQKFFVEQIGKDKVEVNVMVQSGANPHNYEPKPKQMAALSKSKIYFATGFPFEKIWLEKISASNRDMKVVHTDEGIKKITMPSHHHHINEEFQAEQKHHHKSDLEQHNLEQHQGERNDEEQQHDGDKLITEPNSEPDPHIWLSPKLINIQINHILNGLKQADPANADFYDANYKKLEADIKKLDQELEEIFDNKTGVQFMVFHPSWGYFAKDYNIEQMPIEIEGKTPKPAQLKEIIEHAKEKKISVIFVQPQVSVKSASQIAEEIGAEIVFADPLAYNWFENLREAAAKFKSALK